MKVLQINSVCGRQSTGRIVTGIQTTLVNEGFECCVAYGEKNSIVTFRDYHIGTELDRYIHAVLSRLFDAHGCGSILATKRLIQFIKLYKPDVIHLHNLHGYYININQLFRFLDKYNKPVFWTFHDCWPITGHCTHFDLIGCLKWKDGCYSCPQKREYPKSIILDRSKKNYKLKRKLFTNVRNMTIVTPSKWLSEIIKGSFLCKNDIIVVPNGINTSIFKPTKSDLREKYKIGDKRIILGVASVWSERKGLFDYIKLDQMLVDEQYQIVLIGVDEKTAVHLLNTNIVAISKTDSSEELVAWYSVADYFVNFSYEDNFPTVNLEALACGTPVITYATGGSAECLGNDDECGIAIEQGDYARVKEIIDTKHFDSEACRIRGANYDQELRFRDYMMLYSKSIIKDVECNEFKIH